LAYEDRLLLPADEAAREIGRAPGDRYDEEPVGRQAVLDPLFQVLRSDSSRVLFLHGPALSGRTHLLLWMSRLLLSQFSEFSLWPMFVNPIVAGFKNPRAELADDERYMLVADDWEQLPPEISHGLALWLSGNGAPARNTKLIVSCTSAGLRSARVPFEQLQTFASADAIREVEVGPLAVPDFEILLEQFGFSPSVFGLLAERTGRLPGMLVLAKQWLQEGGSPGAFHTSHVFAGIVNKALAFCQVDKELAREVLLWFSLVAPVAKRDRTVNALTDHLERPEADVQSAIADLEHSGHLVERRLIFDLDEVGWCVSPPSLGRYVITAASRDGGDFLMDLVWKALPFNGERVVSNLAIAEVGMDPGEPLTAIDALTSRLQQEAISLTLSQRVNVAKWLPDLAWRRPGQILMVVQSWIENPLGLASVTDPVWKHEFTIDDDMVWRALPESLRRVLAVGDEPEVGRALDLLLELRIREGRQLNTGGSAGEVLVRAFEIKPRRRWDYLRWLLAWVNTKLPLADAASLPILSSCIANLLSLEFMEIEDGLGQKFTVTRGVVPTSWRDLGLADIRRSAIEALFRIIEREAAHGELEAYSHVEDALRLLARAKRHEGAYDNPEEKDLICNRLVERAGRADLREQDKIREILHSAERWGDLLAPGMIARVRAELPADERSGLYQILMGQAELRGLWDAEDYQAGEARRDQRLAAKFPLLLAGAAKQSADTVVWLVRTSGEGGWSQNLARCLELASEQEPESTAALTAELVQRVNAGTIPGHPYALYAGFSLGGLLRAHPTTGRPLLGSLAQNLTSAAAQTICQAFAMIAEPEQVTQDDLELLAIALPLSMLGAVRVGHQSFFCLRSFVGRYRDRVLEILLDLAGRIRPEDLDDFLSAMHFLVKLAQLTNQELMSLSGRLQEVPDIGGYHVAELMAEVARRDLQAWLSILHARFAEGIRRADDRSEFDTLPFGPGSLVPSAEDLDQSTLAEAVRCVRDWYLEFYPIGYLVVSPRSAFTIHGLGRDPLARGRTSALPRGRRGRL